MNLTNKERKLLRLIVKNMDIEDSELAAKLNISEKEIRKIRNKVGDKLKSNLKRKVGNINKILENQ